MSLVLHPVVPDIEIGLSKTTVALMFFPDGIVRPYKINPKGKYFVLNEPKAQGIYTINKKYCWMWAAKTQVYFYVIQETNPIDPVRIHELNNFKTQNKLTEVKLKDIKHGSMLRQLTNKLSKTESFQKLAKLMDAQTDSIAKGIDESINYIQNKTQWYKEKHQREIKLTPLQKSFILLEHIKQMQLIEEKEYSNFLYKVENNILTFEGLLDEIKERQYVSVAEPLDETIEDFIQDLSEQDADSMAGYIDKLRNNRRGLKEQTPKVVKQWFSSMLIAGLIIAATLVPYLISLIGFYNMDIRLLALSGIACIIALARYHYPMFLPPIALVLYPNHVIRPYKIKRGSKFFILNDKIRNIYSLNNKQRWMWDGKVPCYLFEGKEGKENENLVARILTTQPKKKLLGVKMP